jgi:hypothetical protein
LDLHVDAGIGDAHAQGVTKIQLRKGNAQDVKKKTAQEERTYIALAMKLQKTVPIMEESGM